MYGCLWELDMEHLETLDDQEGVRQGFYHRIKLEVWMGRVPYRVSYLLMDWVGLTWILIETDRKLFRHNILPNISTEYSAETE